MRTSALFQVLLACLLGPAIAIAQTGTISGRVTDASGVGLMNVRIDFHRPTTGGWLWADSTVTDGNGNYVKTGLPAGQYAVNTVNPGLHIDETYDDVTCIGYVGDCRGLTPISLSAGASMTNVDFVLATGGTVTGHVTDPARVGLSSVILTLFATRPGGYDQIASTLTDTGGGYLIPRGLPTGIYYLSTFNSQGYVDEVYEDVPCTTSISSCPGGKSIGVVQGLPTANIDFVLQVGGRISGRVTTVAGDGLQDIDIGIYTRTQSQYYSYVGSASTNASGSYATSRGLPPGTYYVRTWNAGNYVDEFFDDVACPSSLSQCPSARAVIVSEGATASDVDFELALGGRVSGRITDSGGNGIQGVTLSIVQQTSDGGLTLADLPSSDASGRYVSVALPGGTYYVFTLNRAGFVDEVYDNVPCPVSTLVDCSGATAVQVSPGATVVDVNFELLLGGTISGRVIDARGRGLADITVHVYQSRDHGSVAWFDSAQTDTSGRYVTPKGLPAGTYQLRTENAAGYVDEVYDNVSCPGVTDFAYCSSTGVDVVAGGPTSNVDFELAPGGKVSGRVTDLTGKPLRDVRVYIYDASSVPYIARASETTNASGEYATRDGLPTGTYYAHTSNSAGYVDELYDDILCPAPNVTLGECGKGTPFSVTAGATTPNVDFGLAPLKGGRAVLPAGDFDGDHKADVAVFRPSTGVWYIISSNTGTAVGISWGQSGDVPAPGDYDGDGRADAAVFRPSAGMWYLLQTTTSSGVGMRWGEAGDVPVPADYDGDGRTDVAVFRPSTGTWFIVRSGVGSAVAITWGQAGDIPVPADFDGDGKADPTVFRPGNGTWYELPSTTNSGFGVVWGQGGDVPIPGDFDGDRKADPTVFRGSNGTWYQLRSTTGSGFGVTWGVAGDQATAGDYDGNGRTDPTVFRPAQGMWYQLRSVANGGIGILWGTSGDLPL